MISADLVGCSTARNKGTCSNRFSIRRDRVEARVLNALRDRLMGPALFAAFCEEFTKEVNQIRIEARTSLAAARREIERIDRELKKLVQAIKDGVPALSLKEELLGKEARKAELVQMLASAERPPSLLHPNMASQYRQQVSELYSALQEESEERRLRASEVFYVWHRQLIRKRLRRGV
jgi:site-specific DNA recombinase